MGSTPGSKRDHDLTYQTLKQVLQFHCLTDYQTRLAVVVEVGQTRLLLREYIDEIVVRWVMMLRAYLVELQKHWVDQMLVLPVDCSADFEQVGPSWTETFEFGRRASHSQNRKTRKQTVAVLGHAFSSFHQPHITF